MRSAILLGLLAVASSINPKWSDGSETSMLYAIAVFATIIMDIVDFITRKKEL